MTELPTIGECRVCLLRPRRLQRRVCAECWRRYTRRWIALCIQARESEEFRASVRGHLSPGARKLFDKMFGPPLREVGE